MELAAEIIGKIFMFSGWVLLLSCFLWFVLRNEEN